MRRSIGEFPLFILAHPSFHGEKLRRNAAT
jgi:hypothetical protein